MVGGHRFKRKKKINAMITLKCLTRLYCLSVSCIFSTLLFLKNSFDMFTKFVWNLQQQDALERCLGSLLAGDTKEFVGSAALWLKMGGRCLSLGSSLWTRRVCLLLHRRGLCTCRWLREHQLRCAVIDLQCLLGAVQMHSPFHVDCAVELLFFLPFTSLDYSFSFHRRAAGGL